MSFNVRIRSDGYSSWMAAQPAHKADCPSGALYRRFPGHSAYLVVEALARIQADYGLRCMIDYWGDNERKSEHSTFAQLEELELALSAEYPYKLLARFLQVIAQKP